WRCSRSQQAPTADRGRRPLVHDDVIDASAINLPLEKKTATEAGIPNPATETDRATETHRAVQTDFATTDPAAELEAGMSAPPCVLGAAAVRVLLGGRRADRPVRVAVCHRFPVAAATGRTARRSGGR